VIEYLSISKHRYSEFRALLQPSFNCIKQYLNLAGQFESDLNQRTLPFFMERTTTFL